MHLRAISDLHLSTRINRDALEHMPDFGDDWLIVAGDLADRLDHVAFGFEELAKRFQKVIWVPGNHELWRVSEPSHAQPPRGVERYGGLIDLARDHGVITPEDPFETWPSKGGTTVIVPMFLLYDYSFRPDHVPRHNVAAWAREKKSMCADEIFLDPIPYKAREDWCAVRCDATEVRLEALEENVSTVLVNHWPLREDIIRIPRAERFTPWCGTRRTADWHKRFRAEVVISGHLHVRRSDMIDGTRFEEVSLGYPKQWDQELGIAHYLKTIF